MQCSDPPRIGPIDVDVATEGRTYIFAFATSPDDLLLLAVPPSAGRK